MNVVNLGIIHTSLINRFVDKDAIFLDEEVATKPMVRVGQVKGITEKIDFFDIQVRLRLM